MRKPENHCFACGEANRKGLRLVFQYEPRSKSASCQVRISKQYQGATGFAHGGMIATLLDEAMAKANGMGGILAVTMRIHVFYRRMVPIEVPLQLLGWRTRRSGRKLYLRSTLKSDRGILLAEAKGVFLEISAEQIRARVSTGNRAR